MTDVDVRLLDEMPGIPAAFARGLATSARRPGAAGGLPTQRLVVADVEQDVRRLADYCEVTGSVLADTVPATWLHVLTFPLHVSLMADRTFPFPMLGMVHVANTMTQHRPVRAAEGLTLSSWVEDLAPHRRGHTVDLVGEVRVGDEVVWQGRSTYLAKTKDKAKGKGEGIGGPTPGTEDRPEVAAARPEHPIPARELAVWRLPADLGRRYAKVSGDANPIHLSAVSAKAFGFPRAIAHGMWSHARALAAVQPRLAGAYRADVRFGKPVLLPSTVVLRGDLEEGVQLAVTSRDGSRTHLSMQVSAPEGA